MNTKDKDELICTCKSVSYRQIEECINNGARTYEDVLEKTGAGSVCGGCIERIDHIIINLITQ